MLISDGKIIDYDEELFNQSKKFQKVLPAQAVYELDQNGDCHEKRYGPGKIYPLKEQQRLAQDMLLLLAQPDRAQKGHWVLTWTAPVRAKHDKISGLFRTYVPTVLVASWHDSDGDLKCNVAYEEDVWTLYDWGLSYCADIAVDAIAEVYKFEKDVEIDPRDQIKRAQGEKPVNPNQRVPQNLI